MQISLHELRKQLSDPHQVCLQLGLLDGHRKQADGLYIRCPSHADSSPSCSVTRTSNGLRVKCFACDFRGDVFTLVAQSQGLDVEHDFPHVLDEASNLLGGFSPTSFRKVPTTTNIEPVPLLVQPVFARVCEQLLSAGSLDSVGCGLAFRGVLEQALVDGWGELPPTRDSLGTITEQSDLVKGLQATYEESSLAWLIRKDSILFRDHRLLIPWRDSNGCIWNMQRRYSPKLGDEVPPKGIPKYVWPSQKAYKPRRKWVYGSECPELQTAGEIWITEGAVDALAVRALHQAGFLGSRNIAVVGIPGVETWDDYKESLLPLVSGKTIVVALDNDDAGKGKVEKLTADVFQARACKVVDGLPPLPFKDWGQVAEQRLWKERQHGR